LISSVGKSGSTGLLEPKGQEGNCPPLLLTFYQNSFKIEFFYLKFLLFAPLPLKLCLPTCRQLPTALVKIYKNPLSDKNGYSPTGKE